MLRILVVKKRGRESSSLEGLSKGKSEPFTSSQSLKMNNLD